MSASAEPCRKIKKKKKMIMMIAPVLHNKLSKKKKTITSVQADGADDMVHQHVDPRPDTWLTPDYNYV